MAGTRTTATQADEAQITRPEAVPPDLLAWADEYFARIKPWIFIREEDNLLIKRPNQAVKLTKTGARALSLLTNGMPVRTLLASLGSRERIAEMTAFLVNIRQHLEGTLLPCQELATIHEPLAINFTHLPILSELAIADGCNLACRFCYAGCAGTTARIARKQLARRQYMRIIEIIARDARVPSISFTGGEPTTNPALPALVRHAKQFDMRVNLITNGTLITPALARELAAAGLDSAQVSIEGPDATTHEALTTIAGSFAASVAGLAALREAGILAHMHTTLTAANAAVAHEMPAFARSLGLARLSMNMLIPTGDAPASPDLAIRYTQIGSIVLGVQQAARAAGVEFFWYSPTPLCLFNPIAHGLGNKGCSACDGLLSIAADGRLAPCSSWAGTLDSILEKGFSAVWDSRQAAAIRAKDLAPPGCRTCQHFAACHGACPIYFNHFGHSELPQPAEVTP